MTTDYTKKQITLEDISKRKLEVLSQIKVQKETIQNTASDLFSPVKATNKMELVMNSVNSGMAAFDGIMTGIKIIRRIRSLFRRRK